MTPAILLARLAARADVAGSDADLLARFRHARDEAAFAELVRRHGPAVYRVCRRLVGPAAADDAFQATFLVLATRSNSVKTPGAVGGWLVGVAGRVARQMRAARIRRYRHETAFAADPAHANSDTPMSLELAEQFRILDEELTRLPDRVRGPVVLCLLEGRTHDQAAADLGGSPRTVRRRLDEAKRLLRLRLERRGVVPTVAAALAAGAGEAATAVPVGLGSRTVAAVFDFLAGGTATTAVPAAIAKGVVTAMIARKLAMVLTAAAVGLMALGVGVGGAGDGPGPAKPAEAKAAEAPKPPLPANKSTFVPPPSPPTVRLQAGPNFVVHAPTEDAARVIAQAAEDHRKQLSIYWLGAELANWDKPCTVRYDSDPEWLGKVARRERKQPAYSFHVGNPADDGKMTATYGECHVEYALPGEPAGVRSLEVNLFGETAAVLLRHIQPQVMMCVAATVAGRPVPLWAKISIPRAGEPDLDRPGRSDRLQQARRDGRTLPLNWFLPLLDNPKGQKPEDYTTLGDQSVSLCRFLLSQKPVRDPELFPRLELGNANPEEATRRGLMLFVRTGIRDGWDKAAAVYGYRSVDELEKSWHFSLGATPSSPSESRPYKTANFTTDAPTAELAKRFGDEAERHRREKSVEWLGTEMPEWPQRCPLKVTVSPGQTGGATTFRFGERNGVLSQEMKIFGDLKQLSTNVLPHEVMHTVLAHHFGRPIPRWADEGICLQAESEEERKNHEIRCRELLNQGRGIPLRHLFRMTEYPNDMIVLFAQGHSVCRFLLSRPVPSWNLFVAEDGTTSQFAPAWPLLAKVIENHRPDPPTRRLLQFVRIGMLKDWDRAAKDVYGFASVDELQDAWTASLRAPLPTDDNGEATPPPSPQFNGITTVAPSQAVNRAIGGEVLYQWRTAGKRWFAGDRLDEPRPGLSVAYQPDGNFNWSADVKYAAGKASVLHFEVAGPLDRVLEREIPFVVTHAALADHLGEGLPAWVVHGLGQLAQLDRYQAKADLDCRDLLRKGKAVRLSALLAGGPTLFTETNANGTQSQEHSVCRFLLTLKPDAELTRFVKLGMANKDWNAAAKRVYDVADADALEAAWLKWMAAPASRLTAPAAATPPPAAPAGPPRIPPTPVSNAAEPDRVGQIVVKGNTVTADRVIVDLLKLYPGQVLEYLKLEEARTNLLRSGLFDATDPPTVTVVPRENGSHFHDIEVRVKETKTGSISLDATANPNAGKKP